MVMSKASTVSEYLEELPDDRRAAIEKVRKTIVKHLPKGYKEVVGWGMITYCIPLVQYPDTYNGQPLCYVGLAGQKNYNALYLTNVYQDPKQDKVLREAFAKAEKKLDMGKSCIRFKTADDLPLETIGKIIASTPPDAFIERYEAIRAETKTGKAKAAKAAAKTTTAKKPTAARR